MGHLCGCGDVVHGCHVVRERRPRIPRGEHLDHGRTNAPHVSAAAVSRLLYHLWRHPRDRASYGEKAVIEALDGPVSIQPGGIGDTKSTARRDEENSVSYRNHSLALGVCLWPWLGKSDFDGSSPVAYNRWASASIVSLVTGIPQTAFIGTYKRPYEPPAATQALG